MSEIGLANITMYFVIIGVCIIFVVTWIIRSEARVNVCKEEIKRLKASLDNSEREKFVLSEKVANLGNVEAPSEFTPQVQDTSEIENKLAKEIAKNNELKDENKMLKKELAEAKSSLAEVYKALS